ncbi:MAG: GNAT family N-acetyltransferase [Pseudomonadota bacterium]
MSTLAERPQPDAPDEVRIVPYAPEHAAAFRELNLQWIREHWTPEAADFEALDDPEGKILRPGGYITVALLGETVIGTCALLPHGPDEFELAKMCVTSDGQGRGVGARLGEAVIAEAQRRGARYVYLETNAILQPAIRLYQRLGFKAVPREPSPYARADVFMRLALD